VSVLPDWVVRAVRKSSDFVSRPITRGGLTRRMFAATRRDDSARPHIAHFKRLARQEAVKLQRGQA
jgi:LysR family transcriptional regulator for metE and metH